MLKEVTTSILLLLSNVCFIDLPYLPILKKFASSPCLFAFQFSERAKNGALNGPRELHFFFS